MDWQKVQNRLNEIIQVDVMTSDKADFMATHMPFEKLRLQYSGRATAEATVLSEEAIYQTLLRNSQNEHRMIIVKGRNGAGKSHLIRWFQTRLEHDSDNPQIASERVVFIRRIDNSLRGAMQQLLDQGVVTDQEQQNRMRAFIESANSQNEQGLMLSIYYSFLTEIESDEDTVMAVASERKRIASFLRDDSVMTYMLDKRGPISRFYELLAKPYSGVNSKEPKFLTADFINMKSAVMESMRQLRTENSNVKASLLRFSNEVHAEKLALLLNSYARTVIQKCAKINQGDAEGMIRNLRAELKKKGQNLTILIEDMTTLTGIDSEMVKVLSIPHTGEYKDLCRVTSVIGITDDYYESRFLGNFKDRVTHQVSVDSQNFEEDGALVNLTARYINAAYLNKKEVENWLEDGADFDKLPYRSYTPGFPWESLKIGEREFTLFPFTSKCLLELYDRLSEKSPRIFLSFVLLRQMMAWVAFNTLQQPFPLASTSELTSNPVRFANNQLGVAFDTESVTLPDAMKKALRVLLCLWGDATLSETKKYERSYIAGLPVEFFSLLGYSKVPSIKQNAVGDLPSPNKPVKSSTPSTVPPHPLPPEQPTKRNTRYDFELWTADQWYQNNKELSISADIRREVYDFVMDAIYWQVEGVPAFLVASRLQTKTIFIEGQLEKSPTRDSAVVILDRSAEDFYFITALIHFRNNNHNWSFPDSGFYQLQAALWLENRKQQIVDKVSGTMDNSLEDILACAMALEYLRIALSGGFSMSDDVTIIRDKLFSQDAGDVSSRSADTDWGRLLTNVTNVTRKGELDENKTFLFSLPNTRLGRPSDADPRKIFFNRIFLDESFNRIDKLNWDATPLLPAEPFSQKEVHTRAMIQLQELLPRAKQVLISELERFHKLIAQAEALLGDELDETHWGMFSQEIAAFLRDLNEQYRINYKPELMSTAEFIDQSKTYIATIIGYGRGLTKASSFSTLMKFFSSDPCSVLQNALRSVEDVCTSARIFADKADRDYARIMDVSTINPARLRGLAEGMNLIDQRMRELRCTPDAE